MQEQEDPAAWCRPGYGSSMGEPLKATIVGGGIAGLASAVALAQAGWQPMIVERAAAFGEVGAGLGVTANGMTALEAIGVDAAVRSTGHQVVHAGVQDSRGRWLLRMRDRGVPRRSTTFWGCTGNACMLLC